MLETKNLELKYYVIEQKTENTLIVMRKSDGSMFVCKIYPGSRVANQGVIDRYEAFAGTEGVTQVIDIISEYEVPTYSFGGTLRDRPLKINIILSTVQHAISPLDIITNDLSDDNTRYIFKQILVTLITMRDKGLVYLPLSHSNVLVDYINLKTLIFDLHNARFGYGPSSLPKQYAIFMAKIVTTNNTFNRPNLTSYILAANDATDLVELLWHPYLELPVLRQ